MLSFEQRSNAIWRALRLKLGESYDWSVVATFDDSVVISRGPAKLERYPVSISGSTVALGEAESVEIVYQALKECAGARILGPLPVPDAEKLTEAELKDRSGRQWAVVLIQEGLSANRRLYTAKALQGAAKLFEGKPAYWTHTASMKAEPDPRDKAGHYTNCRAALLEGRDTKAVAITAVFHATDPVARQRLLEAFEEGRPDDIGISINAGGRGEVLRLPDGPAFRVDAITEAKSADLVAHPAAGGRFLRLVAGMPSVPVTEEVLVNFEQKLAKLRESAPDLAKALSTQPTETEVDALIRVMEARAAANPSAPTPAPAAAPLAPTPAPVTLTEAQAQRLLRLEHTMLVDQQLAGRTMAEPLKASVRASLIERVGMTEAQIKGEVDRFVETSAKLTEPAPQGTGLGQPAGSAEISRDEASKFFEGLEGFFFADADDKVRREYKKAYGKDAPREGFRSLKELYAAATGDRAVTGRFVESKGMVRYARLMEGAAAYFQEAIGTGTLSNAFASTLNRRLLSEYRAEARYGRWRRLVSTIQPLSDFRNQERVRWGHLGDLPIVGQSGTYTELADPTDEKVSYAPEKRGAIVSITREAIKNDDVGIVRQIPTRLALSAARTLFKFVTDFIVTNPTLDDSVALFAASTSRGPTSAGNHQTAALSTTTVGVARQRLLKVKDKDSKTTLGLSPKILIVPPELEELGLRLTSIPVFPVSGQNATEPNIIAEKYGLNELLVLETMADANDYFIIADPRVVDTIEVGFVDGQEEPLILVQDQETVGSVFTSDKWSYKVRHEYGGDVVEWRGMQGGIVA